MELIDSSTALLIDLYEHSPCGFHSLDPDGIFLRINDTELDWLGYSREEMIGRMNLTDILTHEGKQFFAENFPQWKSVGVLRGVECDFVRKDGTTFPVLVNATTVRSEDGKFLMSRAVVYDLSGPRRAGNRAHSVLQAEPDAILICNRQGNITLAGGQTEKVFGYRAEELDGKPLEMLLLHGSRSAHIAQLREFFRSPEIRPMRNPLEVMALRKDGAEVAVELSLAPVHGNGGPAALAIVRDTSERRLAETRVRMSEDRYRSVISAMAEGVVVQERDGKISACNQSAERILGLTEAQMTGRTSIDVRWKAIHEDGTPFPGEMHPSMLVLKTGQRQSNICMGVQRPDGETTWILINGEPVFDPDTGQVSSAVTTFTDITERKKLEQEFLRSQRLEAIGVLAGGVAHDFNNIIGVILGHCDLMAWRQPENQEALHHIESIRRSANYAAALTRQLLAFSRKQVMRMDQLNLNKVVQNLTEMVKRLIGENIELVLHLAPDLGQVNADIVQIEQVLMNLLVNARDAMPKGGRLIVATENIELGGEHNGELPGVTPGPYVLLTVSDTGHGMDEKTASRLFEPYFTTKELGKGTGLGLSIVYGIVRQSKGQISVSSELGKGTTFKVYLPRLSEAVVEETKGEPAVAIAVKGGCETILVVEDDESVREMVLCMLESGGYKVLTAATGEEALSLVKDYSETVALLLSDVVLRGKLDGPSLARKIEDARPGIRILFMSGYGPSLIGEFPGPHDIGELIEKPFTSRDLLQRVRGVLDKAA